VTLCYSSFSFMCTCVWEVTISSFYQCYLFWFVMLKCSCRNGGSQMAPLIGRYCGTTIPRIIPSLSNQLFLQFVSDTSGRQRGFRITWDGTATGMWNVFQVANKWHVILINIWGLLCLCSDSVVKINDMDALPM
jgi:hypothetical protein